MRHDPHERKACYDADGQAWWSPSFRTVSMCNGTVRGTTWPTDHLAVTLDPFSSHSGSSGPV